MYFVGGPHCILVPAICLCIQGGSDELSPWDLLSHGGADVGDDEDDILQPWDLLSLGGDKEE